MEKKQTAVELLEQQLKEGYICPQTKKQCDDECCVSAEDCHIKASTGILSQPKQETLEVKMSKQTALDWYRLESQKLMIKAIRKEISNEEWRLLENKLGEQALQMEREQLMKSYYDGEADGRHNEYKGREQYYNETYGGNHE
jgi:hypothetical protein